jgi:hypothetical protein
MTRKRAGGDRHLGVRAFLARPALALSLAAICLLAISAACASASPPLSGTRERPCKVGGPPAWFFWRIPPGVKRLSPIVTIACGRRLLGRPYEIVAVDTSQGLWAFADSGSVGFSEGTSVLPDTPPSTVTAQSGWAGPPARTHLFGVLGAAVASVEVIFHHRGRPERVVRRPTTAFVGGELLSKLHQTEPFGAYAITFAGCVPPKGVRVVAFNAHGLRVGSARPANRLAHPCNPKTWFHRR